MATTITIVTPTPTKTNNICRTILGGKIAQPYLDEIISTLSSSSSSSSSSSPSTSKRTNTKIPKLLGILASTSAPSQSYANWTQKACQLLGIEYELKIINLNQIEIECAILEANTDDSIDGIMVYYPLFNPQQDGYLQSLVSLTKDVEGLHHSWLVSLYHNQRFITPSSHSLSPSSSLSNQNNSLVQAILPCTPLALVKTLEYCQVYNTLLPYGSKLYGKTITIINRSEPVGRPLAALLSNDGAKVYSVDLDGILLYTRIRSDTSSGTTTSSTSSSSSSTMGMCHESKKCDLTLEQCLRESDAVVAGVPSAQYKINSDWLKEGVVAVNFSENKNFDDRIKEKASLYCPGIGKVTICMLQRNLLRLMEYKNFKVPSVSQVVAE